MEHQDAGVADLLSEPASTGLDPAAVPRRGWIARVGGPRRFDGQLPQVRLHLRQGRAEGPLRRPWSQSVHHASDHLVLAEAMKGLS
jgi:hypothetical protein